MIMRRKKLKWVQKSVQVFHCFYFIFSVILMQRIYLVSSINILELFGDKPPQLPSCHTNVTDGYVTAFCGKNLHYSAEVYKIPYDLPGNLQVLDLSPSDWIPETTFTMSSQDFVNYRHLQTIIIRKNYMMHWGVASKNFRIPVIDHGVFADLFKNILTLKHLDFTDSHLGDNWPITLPRNLKKLTFDQNDFSVLDVHWCPQLEEISANENMLHNIPVLHDPLPPLKILRLKLNPLENMTMLSLAPLCQLKELQLEFPTNTYFTELKEKNYCECEVLVSWLKNVNISGVENVTCSLPNDEEHIDCSKYTKNMIEKANRIREKCLAAVTEAALNKSVFRKVWMYVAYGIATFLMLAGCSAFILWQSNWWPAGDLPSRSSSYVKNEDDEEESSFRDSGSSSVVDKITSR